MVQWELRCHLFAVITLHVEKVGGENVSVDSLLVTCDAALDCCALGCSAEDKLF